MQLWLTTSPGGSTTRRLVRLAKAAEHYGFAGLLVPAPATRRGTVHIGRDGEEVWSTMAAIARGTRRLRIGVLLEPAHLASPIEVALAAAAVDRRSGGRLELGLSAVRAGGGRSRSLLPPMPEGFTRLDETLAVLTGLWWTPGDERFTFTGRYHTVLNHPAVATAQRPGPPLIVSGPGRRTTSYLAARWANEVNVPFRGLDRTVRMFWDADDARAHTERRNPGRSPLRHSAALNACRRPGGGRRVAALLELLATLGQYQSIGTARVYLRLPDSGGQGLDVLARQILPVFAGLRAPAATQPHAC
ncbi:LLM class flavin-dependent oxidoreductase [Phytohabitans sp. LJ34]|uniref:LLM class flavin-dependent oxidoreductase n=1 Tax=Phytohabitans sp. LJ34 TaxID=3452217 RepID=UPI003F88892E